MSTQTKKEKDEDQESRVDHTQYDRPLATASTDVAGSDRRWLDDIEAQLDSTAPYYVPHLIKEIRHLDRMLEQLRAWCDSMSEGESWIEQAAEEWLRAEEGSVYRLANDAPIIGHLLAECTRLRLRVKRPPRRQRGTDATAR
jgi:hypothetical protein